MRLDAAEPVLSVTISKRLARSSSDDAESPRALDLGGTTRPGIHTLGGAEGWARAEVDDEIAAFLAIRAVRRWWETMGTERYPDARRLMVVGSAECPAAATRWPSSGAGSPSRLALR